ncbi:hypothetical protein KCP70_17880 [Salmonella enterica subsp. enterica]|nr:hypothetical protein KCP70_17880 [Salmonella enterica subsp. enterica]
MIMIGLRVIVPVKLARIAANACSDGEVLPVKYSSSSPLNNASRVHLRSSCFKPISSSEDMVQVEGSRNEMTIV